MHRPFKQSSRHSANRPAPPPVPVEVNEKVNSAPSAEPTATTGMIDVVATTNAAPSAAGGSTASANISAMQQQQTTSSPVASPQSSPPGSPGSIARRKRTHRGAPSAAVLHSTTTATATATATSATEQSLPPATVTVMRTGAPTLSSPVVPPRPAVPAVPVFAGFHSVKPSPHRVAPPSQHSPFLVVNGSSRTAVVCRVCERTVWSDTLELHSSMCVVWNTACHDMALLDYKMSKTVRGMKSIASPNPRHTQTASVGAALSESQVIASAEQYSTAMIQLTVNPITVSAAIALTAAQAIQTAAINSTGAGSSGAGSGVGVSAMSSNPLSSLLVSAQQLIQKVQALMTGIATQSLAVATASNTHSKSPAGRVSASGTGSGSGSGAAAAAANESKLNPQYHKSALALFQLMKQKREKLSACLASLISYCATFVASPLVISPPINSSPVQLSLGSLFAGRRAPRIADFEIVKPISRGAFGVVYLARKASTGDLFAMKVLKKSEMIRKRLVSHVIAERDGLAKSKHPFVVKLFYCFQTRLHLYFIMEFVVGGDMFSLLRNVGCLSESDARKYLADAVLAIEYLHTQQIVHRDIKPDNLLIGSDGHLKLTDFGLSYLGSNAQSLGGGGSNNRNHSAPPMSTVHTPLARTARLQLDSTTPLLRTASPLFQPRRSPSADTETTSAPPQLSRISSTASSGVGSPIKPLKVPSSAGTQPELSRASSVPNASGLVAPPPVQVPLSSAAQLAVFTTPNTSNAPSPASSPTASNAPSSFASTPVTPATPSPAANTTALQSTTLPTAIPELTPPFGALSLSVHSAKPPLTTSLPSPEGPLTSGGYNSVGVPNTLLYTSAPSSTVSSAAPSPRHTGGAVIGSAGAGSLLSPPPPTGGGAPPSPYSTLFLASPIHPDVLSPQLTSAGSGGVTSGGSLTAGSSVLTSPGFTSVDAALVSTGGGGGGGADHPMSAAGSDVNTNASAAPFLFVHFVGTPDYLAPEILLDLRHGFACDWWSLGVMCYEWLTGAPPFCSSQSQDQVLKNVLTQEIDWKSLQLQSSQAPSPPSRLPGAGAAGSGGAATGANTGLSDAAIDLMARLLRKKPDERLGSTAGVSEIKSHPFFASIRWDTHTTSEAVFIPEVASDTDTSYFDARHSIYPLTNDQLQFANWKDRERDSGRSSFSSPVPTPHQPLVTRTPNSIVGSTGSSTRAGGAINSARSSTSVPMDSEDDSSLAPSSTRVASSVAGSAMSDVDTNELTTATPAAAAAAAGGGGVTTTADGDSGEADADVSDDDYTPAGAIRCMSVPPAVVSPPLSAQFRALTLPSGSGDGDDDATKARLARMLSSDHPTTTSAPPALSTSVSDGVKSRGLPPPLPAAGSTRSADAKLVTAATPDSSGGGGGGSDSPAPPNAFEHFSVVNVGLLHELNLALLKSRNRTHRSASTDTADTTAVSAGSTSGGGVMISPFADARRGLTPVTPETPISTDGTAPTTRIAVSSVSAAASGFDRLAFLRAQDSRAPLPNAPVSGGSGEADDSGDESTGRKRKKQAVPLPASTASASNPSH